MTLIPLKNFIDAFRMASEIGKKGGKAHVHTTNRIVDGKTVTTHNVVVKKSEPKPK